MTKSETKTINLFIKNIIDENFDDANKCLKDMVADKIKDRIRESEKRQNKSAN